MYKSNTELIVIDAKATEPISTNVVFWSHDKGTAKMIFELQKNHVDQSLATGTKVPILLEFDSATAENGRGKHTYFATIDDAVNGIVSIILEDNILGYQGRVDGSIYIELPDSRSLDTAGRFTFHIKRSPIDEDVPDLEDYYWQGFSEIMEQYNESIAEIKSEAKELLDSLTADVTTAQNKVTTLEQSITTANTNLNARIDEINKKIDDNDVFTKAESSANVIYHVDQLEGKIDTKLANKADKTQVTKVEDMISKMPSATPKETFASLAALQAKYPTGNTSAMVVLEADGVTGYVYLWNGTAWQKGALYQAQGIAVGSIERNKTNFYTPINDVYASSASSFVTGVYYRASDGTLVTDVLWGYVTIKNFQYIEYQLLNLLTTQNRHVTYWNDDGIFLNGDSVNKFTPPNEAKEIRISIRTSEKDLVAIVPSSDGKVLYTDEALLVENSNLPNDLQFSEKNMTFMESLPSSINLIRIEECKSGGYYDYSTGIWSDSSAHSTTNYIPVAPGDIVRSNSLGGAYMYTNFWDAEFNWVTGVRQTTDVVVPMNSNISTVTCTFKPTSGDTFETAMVTVNQVMPEKYIPTYQFRFKETVYLPTTDTSNIDGKYSINYLKGKSLVANGDSIVSAENRYDETITGYIKRVASYFDMTLSNHAISGSTVAVKEDSPTERTPISTRYTSMKTTADVVYLQAGTNDWQYSWTPIGTMSDRTVNTFYGALHVLLNGLMERYPAKPIIYALPIKRRTTLNDVNDLGKTLWNYCEIIKEVCDYYSIPVLDLYHDSMLNPHIAAQKTAFLPDGTHPNNAGHEILARPVIGRLKTIY